jgi:membrane protein DedA with SNARE-associated domain
VTPGLDSTWWQYLLLFIAVVASWAGVPAVGTAALGAAAVAASQDKLDLATVIVVATIAGEAGGLGGYVVGRRWGRRLLERPPQRARHRHPDHRARRRGARHRGRRPTSPKAHGPASCG